MWPDAPPFEGFEELVRQPLQSSDPQSFDRMQSLLVDEPEAQGAPISYLVQKLGGRTFDEVEARKHWRRILANKSDMEAKLGRVVAVQTAAVDYFTSDRAADAPAAAGKAVGKRREAWIDRVCAPSYHAEKLKEEVLRARRYNHALSAIMIDIDDFSRINEQYSSSVGDEILTLVVKIMRKSVRTVDIVSRYAGDVFLIILPNTNKREAAELAERIRQNIPRRTKRIEQLGEGVTVTMSVAQCAADESSADFVQRMEGLLESGKTKTRNAVYAD